jgi:Flp pilus assembly protein CpaB
VALRKIERDSAIGQGDVLDKSKVVLSGGLENFMRAVTINVDAASGVGGFVKPRDRVDVIATYGRGDKAGVETVLQNVEVLAVGTRVKEEPVPVSGQDKASGMESPGGKATVTLAVTPIEAERLALAADEGKLTLSLRPVEDDVIIDLGQRRPDIVVVGPKDEGRRPRQDQQSSTKTSTVRTPPPSPVSPPPVAPVPPKKPQEPEATSVGVETILGSERKVIQVPIVNH